MMRVVKGFLFKESTQVDDQPSTYQSTPETPGSDAQLRLSSASAMALPHQQEGKSSGAGTRK